MGFGIEGKNLPNLDEGIEKYHETYCEIYVRSKHENWDFIYYCDDLFDYNKRYQKLKIESYFATEWGLGYEFYRANANKYKFMWTHKSSQNLQKMNKKFKLIKRNDNVVIFGNDEFNGWKDVALDKCGISGHVLLEDKIETSNNQESLIANVILSNKSLNYCGIKDFDIKKIYEFGKFNNQIWRKNFN